MTILARVFAIVALMGPSFAEAGSGSCTGASCQSAPQMDDEMSLLQVTKELDSRNSLRPPPEGEVEEPEGELSPEANQEKLDAIKDTIKELEARLQDMPEEDPPSEERVKLDRDLAENYRILADEEAAKINEVENADEDAVMEHSDKWDHLGNGVWSNKESQVYRLMEDTSVKTNLTGKIAAKKAYIADLEKYGDEKKETKMVMRLTKFYYTAHDDSTAMFRQNLGNSEPYVGMETYALFKPSVWVRNTWAVSPEGDEKNKLFTIDRRRSMSGPNSVRIHVGDSGALIYYGVSTSVVPSGFEEKAKLFRDFRFYHSKEAFEVDKEDWAAKIHQLDRYDKDKGATYLVSVRAGEDAAILMLGAVCVHKTGEADIDYSDAGAHMGHNDG